MPKYESSYKPEYKKDEIVCVIGGGQRRVVAAMPGGHSYLLCDPDGEQRWIEIDRIMSASKYDVMIFHGDSLEHSGNHVRQSQWK